MTNKEMPEEYPEKPSIENSHYSDSSRDKIMADNYKILGDFFDMIRNKEAQLRVTRNIKENTWKAEIYKIADNEVIYSTDMPDEVMALEKTHVDNGHIPEYVEKD